MSTESHSIEKTEIIELYCAYNQVTNKICILALSSTKKNPFTYNVEGREFLKATLTRLTSLLASLIGGNKNVQIVIHRFKDNNLGHCLSRVIKILNEVDTIMSDKQDEYIHRSLLARNGSKTKTYDEMKKLLDALIQVKRTNINFTLESRKTFDSVSKVAWTFIK